jgi:anti-anti-sigma regulatory factor
LRDRSSHGTRSTPGGTAVLKEIYPVRWAGRQAVVTLPEHIGASNAGQIREELLSVISHGAETVIADMTTTLSCDHAGVDAVVRACQRAVISGVELRLVVVARISDLDGLVSIYPSLEAAVAAGPPDGNGIAVPPAAQAHHSLELLDTVITSLFHVGLSLELAMDLPADAAREHIEAAVAHLDETIREVRDTAFTARAHETASGTPPRASAAAGVPADKPFRRLGAGYRGGLVRPGGGVAVHGEPCDRGRDGEQADGDKREGAVRRGLAGLVRSPRRSRRP